MDKENVELKSCRYVGSHPWINGSKGKAFKDIKENKWIFIPDLMVEEDFDQFYVKEKSLVFYNE